MQKCYSVFLIFFILCFTTKLHSYNCGNSQECCAWHCQKELLFWTTHENGLEYTTKKSDVLTTDDFTKKDLIHPSFHWEYGFRLAGGYAPPCTNWDFSLSWAYIANKATGVKNHEHCDDKFEGIFPVWTMSPDTLSGDYVSKAKMRWILHTSIIDFDALYTCWKWGRFQFNPLLSVRCAILNQKLHVKYEGGCFYSGIDDNLIRNRFTGVGPRLGATGSYYLFRNIYAIGLFAASGLYGHFKTSHKEEYLEECRFHMTDSCNRLEWCLDYQLGLQWRGKTLSCWPDVLLALSWEGHTFFNQNRMYRGQYDFFNKNRNLTLKGWTLTATFCF